MTGCSRRQQFTSTTTTVDTTTTSTVRLMLTVLSLSVTSSFVVASSHNTTELTNERSNSRSTSAVVTRLGARLNVSATNMTTVTAAPHVETTTHDAMTTRVAAGRPATSRLSPSTRTTAVPSPTAVSDIYVRGHRIRQGDRRTPEAEVDRSTYDDDDVERPSNKTTRQQLGDGGDDDGFRRRRFHFIRASQVIYYLSV